MGIGRRILLQGILGSTLTVDSPLIAEVPDRYRELVQAQHDLILLLPLYREASPTTPNRRALAEDLGINAAMEYVLHVLINRFGDTTPIAVNFKLAKRRVYELIFAKNRDEAINTFDENELRLYEDYIVNVAVMKTLLAYHKVQFDAAKSAGFRVFVDRYRDVVL